MADEFQAPTRPRRPTLEDRDADQGTYPGRLRHLAFMVSACTIGVAGGDEYEIAESLLELADELAHELATGRPQG